MARKKVLIAYTGGTIGMRLGPIGYAPAPGYLAERMAAMPELHDPEVPEYQLHAYQPLLDSADMSPADWNRIAEDIAGNYQAFDGFVVIHGTDTMAYTASALSFMLANLAKPVILTGSQIPLSEARSDAHENLVTSMILAATSGLPEVGIYLNGRLLRGNRSTKVSAFGFDAFDSPNVPPLAEVGVDIVVRRDLALPTPDAPLRLSPRSEVEVAALRLFPELSSRILENTLREPLRGLVLETYGAGNAPSNNPRLLAALADASERGVVIVNCSQCLRGRVNMTDYATGNALAAAGVIGGADMTAEAALTKLGHLLGLGLPSPEVRRQMVHNLRGELTPLS